MAENKNKYVSLSKLSIFFDNLKNIFSPLVHTHKISDITDYAIDSELSSTSNNPVANNIINAEFDAISDAMGALELAINGKSNDSHVHNDLYYTEAEVDEKLDGKADSEHTHSNYVPVERKVNGKELNADIALTASDVGALPDTTEIPGVLADLADDATHRTVSDAEKEAWNAKSDFSGSYNDLTDKPTIPSIAGLATETYVDDQITGANTYTDDKIALLLNNSSEAVDSIMELAAAMEENEDVVAALESAIGTKVDKVDGMGLSSNDFTNEEKVKLNSPVPTDNVVHGEAQDLLSTIIETYILNIDYSSLTFDVTEIVFDGSSSGTGSGDSSDTSSQTNAVLGYAVLGQMVLA